MSDKHYDLVIVGAGVCGSIVAKQLAARGKSILILEAGTTPGAGKSDDSDFLAQYEGFMDRFFKAPIKYPNSPYPANSDAPAPSVMEISKTPESTKGYLVQNGPLPFASTYTRNAGGTTLHWLGTCLRMLPNDFEMLQRYGKGRNWPINYKDMTPYYEEAEREIGVSADVEDQAVFGIKFPKDYVYPMHKMPQSYLDQSLIQGRGGQKGLGVFNTDSSLKVTLEDEAGSEFEVGVISTPQGRNGMPNPAYNKGAGFIPVGAVGDGDQGQRCEGNANCVPICPVQAKYNAVKTLSNAVSTGNVDIEYQAVAYHVDVDPNGKVTGVRYKKYYDSRKSEFTTHTAKGIVYVIAAHSIETAKLLLASNICRNSDELGRNLMDHICLLRWGLMPGNVGPYRGPGSTSGIPGMRDGVFRRKHSSCRIEIGNWGWSWPKGSPYSSLAISLGGYDDNQIFDGSGDYGAKLRRQVANQYTRAFRLAFENEQLPDPSNRVTIDPAYKDALGNYRPVIDYNVDDYTRHGMAVAKKVSDKIFETLNVQDFSKYEEYKATYYTYRGEGYEYDGAGHVVGTHRMGNSAGDSVVNKDQQCWDHKNLFLVGCGNFPTLGTSNPSLTMAALAFRAAEFIENALR